MVLIFAFAEVYYQFYRRKADPFIDPKIDITAAEFEARVAGGEELVILDDLVLDVSEYQWNHPGGRFVIQQCIGRDVSKFFYGGYALEVTSGHRPYFHSNVARAVVNSLIIARLDKKTEDFICKQEPCNQICSDTNTFLLQATEENPNFMIPASYDIKSFGKHFLIRGNKNPQVARHYTISTSMTKIIYEEYLRVIKVFLEKGLPQVFDDQVL